MLHTMKLKQEPFEKIRNGDKTIELRLYDEKRQQVQVGDFIELCLIDNPREKLQTRVTALHRFDSFQKLYASLPKEKLGYKNHMKYLNRITWMHIIPVRSRRNLVLSVLKFA